MPQSNILVLVASALVAGVVSFLVGGSKPTEPDPRIAKLESALQTAQAELAALKNKPDAGPSVTVDVDAIKQAVRADVDAVRKTATANGAGIGNLTEMFQKADTTFTKLQQDYKALNGRIEANYQKGRELDKRMEALEGR